MSVKIICASAITAVIGYLLAAIFLDRLIKPNTLNGMESRYTYDHNNQIYSATETLTPTVAG